MRWRASACQEAEIVPIVDPEVIMDGTPRLSGVRVTTAALTSLYEQLGQQGVHLEGTILKPNMVVSGLKIRFRPA